MKIKRFPVPLREDFELRLIVSNGSDFEKIAEEVSDTELEYIESVDGFSEFDGELFTIVIIRGGVDTLVHECGHFAFNVSKKFGIQDEEFYCMMLEWAFVKCKGNV